MNLVLDSSVTLAFLYSEEATPAVLEVFKQVVAGGAWVTALWRLEVANVLEMGVRRGRTDAAFRNAALRDLALLPIRTDPETDAHAWGETLRIAEKHKLTIYDATYLELAKRQALPLATLDMELRAAAKSEKLQLLGI